MDGKSYILELFHRKNPLDRDMARRGGCRERFSSRMKPSNKSLKFTGKVRVCIYAGGPNNVNKS